MKANTKHVAMGIALSILMATQAFSDPGSVPETNHNAPAAPVAHPPAAVDTNKLLDLIVDNLTGFTATLVVAGSTSRQIEVRTTALEKFKEVFTKAKKLGNTLKACAAREDRSSEHFAALLDSYVALVGGWLFDDRDQQKTTIRISKKALEVYTHLFAEYFKKKAQTYGREDAWDQSFMSSVKQNFKNLAGADFSAQGMDARITSLRGPITEQADGSHVLDAKLKAAVSLYDDAAAALTSTKAACNVATPASPANPNPSTGPGLNPGPGAAPAGATAPPPAAAGAGTAPPDAPVSPVAPINPNDEISKLIQGQLDRLNGLNAQIEKLKADQDRRNAELEALAAKDNNAADAAKEIAKLLGQQRKNDNNQAPPVAPQTAQLPQPQPNDQPTPTPPVDDSAQDDQQQPSPLVLPPTPSNSGGPIFLGDSKPNSALFDDLYSRRSPVPVADATADIFKQMRLWNQELLMSRMQPGMPGFGMNSNTIASRLMGVGVRPLGIRGQAPMFAAATRNGAQGALAINPGARGPLPKSLQ